MIAVIDYGMGNLRSVSKALERVGAEVEVTSQPERIATAAAVVLPGVGAFRRCMENLEAAGLVDSVKEAAGSGKPFLGICVGMQILFKESLEFGHVPGLGILPGRVVPLRPKQKGLKVPHMGWNKVHLTQRPPILKGVPDAARVYFVHSFYVDCDIERLAATTTHYGLTFASSVVSGNLFATQFHPEKSQAVGLRLLENFAALSAGGQGAPR